MSLNAKDIPFGGSNMVAEPLEAGTYPGRLVQVIDLGLQPQQYLGEDKAPAYSIFTTYELVDEFLKDKDGNDIEDKPRGVSENFALHNIKSEKATSTKRYNALDPNNIYTGDWVGVLGAPVMVTLVQNPGKGKNTGKIYNKIVSTSAMRAKDAAKVAPLVNPTKVFDLDAPDVEVFNALPDWLKERITSNLEFKGSKLEKLLGGAAPSTSEPPLDIDDEESPF